MHIAKHYLQILLLYIFPLITRHLNEINGIYENKQYMAMHFAIEHRIVSLDLTHIQSDLFLWNYIYFADFYIYKRIELFRIGIKRMAYSDRAKKC